MMRYAPGIGDAGTVTHSRAGCHGYPQKRGQQAERGDRADTMKMSEPESHQRSVGTADQIDMLGLLEQRTRSELASLAAVVPPHLSVLYGEQPDLLEACAATLGGHWVPRANRQVDLVVVEPDGRWSVDQIRETVLVAARVSPLSRRVLVLCSVDYMTRDGFDMLLKTIEEPPPSTVFVLTVSDVNRLPQTVRGRISAMVHVRGVYGTARQDFLVKHGWVQEAAEEAVRLSLPARWLGPIGQDPALLQAFSSMQQKLITREGASRRATDLLESVEHLVERGAEFFGSGDSSARAARRSVVEWLLRQEEKDVRARLQDDLSTIRAESRLLSIEAAREQLAGNASLLLVLNVLLRGQDSEAARV